MASDWRRPEDVLPEHGERVDWISPVGHQIDGGKYDGLWFLPDGVYVYYQPAFWRRSQQHEEPADE